MQMMKSSLQLNRRALVKLKSQFKINKATPLSDLVEPDT